MWARDMIAICKILFRVVIICDYRFTKAMFEENKFSWLAESDKIEDAKVESAMISLSPICFHFRLLRECIVPIEAERFYLSDKWVYISSDNVVQFA